MNAQILGAAIGNTITEIGTNPVRLMIRLCTVAGAVGTAYYAVAALAGWVGIPTPESTNAQAAITFPFLVAGLVWWDYKRISKRRAH